MAGHHLGKDATARQAGESPAPVRTAIMSGPDTYGQGLDRKRILGSFRTRLAAAKPHVASREDVGRAVAALTRSSIALRDAVLALDAAALDGRWIEYATADAADAAAALGSPLEKSGQVPTTAVGFLISTTGTERRLLLEMVVTNLFSMAGLRMPVTDLSPTRGVFDMAPNKQPPFTASTTPPGVVGAFREHYHSLANDPKEASAAIEIPWRISWEPHPDLAAVAAAQNRMKPGSAAEYWQGTGIDLVKHATMVLLPLLAIEAGLIPT